MQVKCHIELYIYNCNQNVNYGNGKISWKTINIWVKIDEKGVFFDI